MEKECAYVYSTGLPRYTVFKSGLAALLYFSQPQILKPGRICGVIYPVCVSVTFRNQDIAVRQGAWAGGSDISGGHYDGSSLASQQELKQGSQLSENIYKPKKTRMALQGHLKGNRGGGRGLGRQGI